MYALIVTIKNNRFRNVEKLTRFSLVCDVRDFRR